MNVSDKSHDGRNMGTRGPRKSLGKVLVLLQRICVNFLCKDEQEQDSFAHVFITGKQGGCSREEMISLDVLMFLGD